MFFHLYNSFIFPSFQILIGTEVFTSYKMNWNPYDFFFVCFNLYVRISFGVFSKDPFTLGASLIQPISVGFFGEDFNLKTNFLSS